MTAGSADPDGRDGLAQAPLTDLVFRVGVVGHRRDQFPANLDAVIRPIVERLLAEVRTAVEAASIEAPDLYRPGTARLHIVSSLAEGSDRLVAEAAMRLGYALCCPAPFSPAAVPEGPDSRASIDAFLRDRPSAPGAPPVVLQLDGTSSRKDDAYAAAAQIVLNQSDLLIAIWNGRPPAGPGGTADTVAKALECRVPVVWLDPRQAGRAHILLDGTDLQVGSEGTYEPSVKLEPTLAKVIRDQLVPPESSGWQRYHSERRPTRRLGLVWRFFRDFLGNRRPRLPTLGAPDFEQDAARAFPTEAVHPFGWINDRLRPHYAWADGLAELNADAYRSSFILAYMLSTAAGLAAVVPLSLRWTAASAPVGVWLCPAVELAAVAVIGLLLVGGGKKRRDWHNRWLDYRILAELVRQLRFQIPLGGGRPLPRAPLHFAEGNPALSWMYAHARRIERESALAPEPPSLTDSYVRTCLEDLDLLLDKQITFHETAHLRADWIHKRLHLIGACLFVLTGGIALAELVLHALEANGLMEVPAHLTWVTLFSVSLPTLGAGIAAINNQGEFKRVEQRSAAMKVKLKGIRDRLTALRGSRTPISSGQARKIVADATQLMVDEVLDWRALFLDRPLVPPA